MLEYSEYSIAKALSVLMLSQVLLKSLFNIKHHFHFCYMYITEHDKQRRL